MKAAVALVALTNKKPNMILEISKHKHQKNIKEKILRI